MERRSQKQHAGLRLRERAAFFLSSSSSSSPPRSAYVPPRNRRESARALGSNSLRGDSISSASRNAIAFPAPGGEQSAIGAKPELRGLGKSFSRRGSLYRGYATDGGRVCCCCCWPYVRSLSPSLSLSLARSPPFSPPYVYARVCAPRVFIGT